MAKWKFTEKNIFLCMTAYRYDAFMNHTENMSLEIKENNMFIHKECAPKFPNKEKCLIKIFVDSWLVLILKQKRKSVIVVFCFMYKR